MGIAVEKRRRLVSPADEQNGPSSARGSGSVLTSTSRHNVRSSNVSKEPVKRPPIAASPRDSFSEPPAPQQLKKYHIPANIAGAGALSSGVFGERFPIDAIGKVAGHRYSGDTDTVDLDLSFDFVSPIEASRRDSDLSGHLGEEVPAGELTFPQSSQERTVDTYISSSFSGKRDSQAAATPASSSPSRPRGMADSMSASGSRRQPPRPLTLANCDTDSQRTSSNDIGQFNSGEILPLSPPLGHIAGNGPLLTSRKRAGTLSTVPPTEPPSAPLPPLPTAANQKPKPHRDTQPYLSHREDYMESPMQPGGPLSPNHPIAVQSDSPWEMQSRWLTFESRNQAQAMRYNYSSSSSHLGDTQGSTSSPASAQQSMSTPDTPFSSIFDARSESAKMATTLSDAPSYAKVGKSVDIGLMTGAICEEPVEQSDATFGSHGENKGGLTTVDTAGWIQAQRKRAVSAAVDDSDEVDPGRREEESMSSSNTLATTESTGSFLPGVGRPILVVSTSTSSNEVDAELGGNRRLRKGPWAQSPLLLEQPPKSDSGIGLGLFLGGKEAETRSETPSAVRPQGTVININRMQMSEVSLPAIQDWKLSAQQPPRASEAPASESFALNATQPSKILRQTRRSSSLAEQTEKVAGPSSHKLASTSRRLSSLMRARDSAKEVEPQASMSPRLKPLTLVDQRQHLSNRQSGTGNKSHPKSFIRRHTIDLRHKSQEDSGNIPSHIASSHIQLSPPSAGMTPHTAPLPASATFTPEEAVPTTFEMSRRSSKHVRRMSRLQYVPSSPDLGLEDTRLTMPMSAVISTTRGFNDPQLGSSPSDWTPDKVYNGHRSRLSWGYAPRSRTISPMVSQSPAAPHERNIITSPWQGFTEADTAARRSQLSGSHIRQDSYEANESFQSSVLVTEGGLRRRPTLERQGQRTTVTLPPTAVIRPFVSSHDRKASVHSDILVQDGSLRLGHLQEDKGLRRLRLLGDLPPEEQGSRPMSVFVPVSTLQAHLRAKALEDYQERIQVRTRQAMREPLIRSPLGMGHDLLNASERLLDSELPSRTLFFMGFLGMPWLWLLGGWWLANDGMLVSQGGHVNRKVEFYTHEPSMQEAERHFQGRDHEASQRRNGLATQSMFSTASSGDMNRRMYDDEFSDELGNRHDRLECGKQDVDYLQPGLDHPRSLSASTGWTGKSSPRNLVSSRIDRLPRNARRSMGSLLNPHPEVALFHSPIRSVNYAGVGDEGEFEAAGLHCQSASRLSGGGGNIRGSSSRSDAWGRSASGLDQISDVDEPNPDAVSHPQQSATSLSTRDRLEDVAPFDRYQEAQGKNHDVGHRRSMSLTTLSMLKSLQDLKAMPSEQAMMKLTPAQRLALTERYVLMNRFMAVVSTLAVFAGFGAALNAVAMNF